MIYSHLICPKHKFAYVSMPRLEDERENDSGRLIAKCPLRWCFHGLRKPMIVAPHKRDMPCEVALPGTTITLCPECGRDDYHEEGCSIGVGLLVDSYAAPAINGPRTRELNEI